MEKKELYMIGNSHIDPVWFWNWEEGMQEVKATYASALERMKEFEDFKFTSTSTLFFEWIEGILPEMFEEIKQRVAEGRWEITGGWFLEPDCILPCGEAFVRQGLYAQRYLKSRFGRLCTIGSNVDSFGHNHVLPQILKKSGMDAYVFMRPRLDTPVFVWEGADGSQVNAISLPAEYTTWFHEPTVKNIETTLERTKGYEKMPCCYGVGNHGGGPTIENINSILSLQKASGTPGAPFAAYGDVSLRFSSYTEFLEDLDKSRLSVIKGPFEKVNEGCYSIDSYFKSLNRLAERRLIEADCLMSMAACAATAACTSTAACAATAACAPTPAGTSGEESPAGPEWMKQTEEMENLWKTLLFNEFHDTMGGTTIKQAREEAIMQMSGVCAGAGKIKALAIQKIVNGLSTLGEGFPLVLFNTDSQPYDDYVETELEWFCQAPLKLLDADGKEIPYQRIHTDAKVRHTTLGGRRRFVFRAHIPAFGFAVYRTVKSEPALCCNNQMEIDNPAANVLENDFIRAEFDTQTGALVSLVEKSFPENEGTEGYDALKGACSIRVYRDERDAWGGLQGRRYEDRNETFRLISMEKVESGKIREVIRVRTAFEGTTLEQLYSLGAQEKELCVENRLVFNHTWTLLKAAFPTGKACSHTEAETAYGTLERTIIEDISEFYMQRFLDVSDEDGRGLAIANDGKYAFNMEDGRTQITLCRSAIYAQGNSPEWYNEKESYQYTDIGPQTFHLILKPHGKKLPRSEAYRIAKKANGAYEYLADSAHPGREQIMQKSFAGVRGTDDRAACDVSNVRIMLVKKCEDDNSFIIRLLETEGKDTAFMLEFNGRKYPIQIGHEEILTLKIEENAQQPVTEVNLLEWNP